MYDILRQSERIGDSHHQYHHHNHLQSHVAYHPTSFRRVDPQQAYSLHGLYTSDVVTRLCSNNGGHTLPTTGVNGSNYSPVSLGSPLAEHVMQHQTWSKSVAVDTGAQWHQRQFCCPTLGGVSATYRRGPAISKPATSTVTGTSGLVSDSVRSSSLAVLQRLHHYSASRAQPAVTCIDDDKEEKDVDKLGCGASASPSPTAACQLNSSHADSNILYVFTRSIAVV